MNTILSFLLFMSVLFSSAAYAGWDLVWSDEFDYSGLPDAAKWGYDIGGSGWGNQELQYYTENRLENARVEDSVLIITAIKEPYEGMNYTSTRLISKNKGDWLYGRVEVAAKLPQGTGLWPAIWMLPTDWEYGNWPASGELDIMENVGYDPYRVHFNIHTEAYNHSIGTNKGNSTTLADPHTTFNVYALEWFEDHVDFFANGDTVFTFENEDNTYREWPFDKRFHLLLNIAVGGTWGGQEGVDDDIFPQEFIIDYVRVYKENTSTVVKNRRQLSQTGIRQRGNNICFPSVHQRGTIHLCNLSGTCIKTFSVTPQQRLLRLPDNLTTGLYIIRFDYGAQVALNKTVFGIK